MSEEKTTEQQTPKHYEPNEKERTQLARMAQNIGVAKIILCDAQHAHEAAINQERGAAAQVEQAQKVLFAAEREEKAVAAFLALSHDLQGSSFQYDGKLIRPER